MSAHPIAHLVIDTMPFNHSMGFMPLRDITETHQTETPIEIENASQTFFAMTKEKKGKKALCIYVRRYQLCLYSKNWKETKVGKKIIKFMDHVRFDGYLKTILIDIRIRARGITDWERRETMRFTLKWTLKMNDKENIPIFMKCGFCDGISPFQFNNIWNNPMKGCLCCLLCYHEHLSFR